MDFKAIYKHVKFLNFLCFLNVFLHKLQNVIKAGFLRSLLIYIYIKKSKQHKFMDWFFTTFITVDRFLYHQDNCGVEYALFLSNVTRKNMCTHVYTTNVKFETSSKCV